MIELEKLTASELAQMVQELQQAKTTLDARRFVETEMARFAGLLRWRAADTLASWGGRLLDELVPVVGGLHAALYVREDTITGESANTLMLIAGYAFNKNDTPERVTFGEGLIGQTAITGRGYTFQAPTNHFFSALFAVRPQELRILPLINDEEVLGVIEISSLRGFYPPEIELIHNLCQDAAATLVTIRDRQNIQRLYAQAQERAIELQQKEELLRRNLAEMLSTQEALSLKQDESLAQQALLQALINSATDSIVAIDTTFRVILANNLFLTHYSRDPQQVILGQTSLFDPILYISDDAETWETNAYQALAGQIVRVEKVYLINEIETTAELTFFPIRRASGEIMGASVTVKDITAAKQLAAQRLHQKDVLLQALINSIGDQLFSVDRNYCYSNFNRAYLQMMEAKGLVPQIGLSSLDFFTEKEKPKWKYRFDRALRGEQISVEEYHQVQGQDMFVEITISPIPGIDGQIAQVSVLTRDITARRQTVQFLENSYGQLTLQQQALEQERERLKKMAEYVPGMLFQWKYVPDTRQQQFLYVSKGVEEIFGLAANVELPGTILRDKTTPEHAQNLRESIIKALASGEWNWEGVIRLPDNTQKRIKGMARAEKQPDHSLIFSGILLPINNKITLRSKSKSLKTSQS